MAEVVTVIARIEVAPGSEETILALMPRLTADLQAEPGLRQFTPHQCRDKANVFYFYEQFRDQEAFDIHLREKHTIDFLTFLQTVPGNRLDVEFLRPLAAAHA